MVDFSSIDNLNHFLIEEYLSGIQENGNEEYLSGIQENRNEEFEQAMMETLFHQSGILNYDLILYCLENGFRFTQRIKDLILISGNLKLLQYTKEHPFTYEDGIIIDNIFRSESIQKAIQKFIQENSY